MNKPQEKWVLEFVNEKGRILTFKEISDASYWSISATRGACYSLVENGLLGQGDRIIVDGQAHATYMPISIARKKQEERIDGHILSQYWPTKIRLPHGSVRFHRGLIHDEAA
jgi:hypothetical protein